MNKCPECDMVWNADCATCVTRAARESARRIEPKPCPECGAAPSVNRVIAWHVSCTNCYDGAPDAGKQLHGYDLLSRDAAVDWWNQEVESYIEDRAS